MSQLINTEQKAFEALVHRVVSVIEEARGRVLTSINLAEVYQSIRLVGILLKRSNKGQSVLNMVNSSYNRSPSNLLNDLGQVGRMRTLKTSGNFIKSTQKG